MKTKIILTRSFFPVKPEQTLLNDLRRCLTKWALLHDPDSKNLLLYINIDILILGVC